MSGNPNQFEGWDDGWSTQDLQVDGQYAAADMLVNADQLTYNQRDYELQNRRPDTFKYAEKYDSKLSFFYDQRDPYERPEEQSYFKPAPQPASGHENFEEEPPLLEELGIDPDQIVKKVMVVLDPFHTSVPLGEYDLAGPLLFCLFLALTMLLSGGKVNFSYVYGIALSSCLMMYALLWLMSSGPHITLVSVASVLGYSLLPVVILSGVSIFLTLRTFLGYLLAVFAVGWASLAASRIFVTMSTDQSQRPLIAYPCALLYAVFTLLVIF